MAGPGKGLYYDAYVMIDIYSRYIVGCHVHHRESEVLATELMEQIFGTHGIPHVVHADRGTAMTSKSVTALLADLEVTRSHSRPRVSNDNPYSEAWFKTLKYAPEFPSRFGSLWQARQFMDQFVDWYTYCHRHTGIGLHTPAQVFYGLAAARDAQRRQVLAAARVRHPHRFGGVTTAPKIIDLPEAAWINQPEQENQNPPSGITHRVVSFTLKNSGKAGAGLSAAEREELTRLRKEVRDLKQANDILKAASAFSRGNCAPRGAGIVERW
ncbi:DDE-type integrase/transposase/recombinase [Nocardia seriolae]|uniref:DDE-type integrase/transposase/recombinase n=1 Tax=Nocardia seriolae TaxID=37332 RepID=UPI003EBBE6F5